MSSLWSVHVHKLAFVTCDFSFVRVASLQQTLAPPPTPFMPNRGACHTWSLFVLGLRRAVCRRAPHTNPSLNVGLLATLREPSMLGSRSISHTAQVDFAVTSGLRDDLVNEARQDPAAVWGRYEDMTRSYQDTAAECQRQGLTFLPFVVEAHGGGFGPMARRAVAHIAKAGAATEGEEVERQAANTVRRMSCSVHRQNARAVLRRFPAPPTGFAVSGPEAWGEDLAWQ